MSQAAEAYELHAEMRAQLGKAHSRRMRRIEDKTPAVIYGIKEDPEHITLDHNKVSKALENEGFYSHILTLIVNGKKQRAVLKAIQRHPFKPRITHIDFLRISETAKLTMNVPLHFLHEDIAPGVKLQNGIVSHLENSVTVSCLPADLPEFIEVDVSQLNIDESLHLSDLQLPKGVESVDLAHNNNKTIVSIHIPRAVVEAEPIEAPVTAEVPTHREEAAAKAEATPAEGGKAAPTGGKKEGKGKE